MLNCQSTFIRHRNEVVMKTLNLVCVGLALSGLIVSAILWHDLRAQRVVMAEWQRAHPEAGSVNSAQPRATQDSATTAAAARAGNVRAGAPDAHPAAHSTPASISDLLASERERLKNPEYRRNVVARARPSTQQAYPGLAEKLELAPDEADRLFDLLAEHQLELNALPELTLIEGPSNDAAQLREVTRLHQETRRRQEQSLASLLGNARYARWQEYQDARLARQQALQQYGAAMTALGQPLSEAQVQALTATLVAEGRQRRQDLQGMRNLAQPGSGNPAQLVQEITRLRMESNKRIVAAVRPILSAVQFESLRTTLDRQAVAMGGGVGPSQ
jgi:hypothetical protein